MILLTVGTQKFPMNRLLRRIDELIQAGEITDEVFAQIGHATYEPKHYKTVRFLSPEEYNKAIAECDLLITHSGVGSIMTGLRNEKKIIVFPRLSAYGEHVDDHQLQIAESFADSNFVLSCTDSKDLGEKIREARVHQFVTYVSNRENAIETIRVFINGE